MTEANQGSGALSSAAPLEDGPIAMDYSSAGLDIIDPSGAKMTRMLSIKSWTELMLGAADLSVGRPAPIAIDEFLREEHHCYYGRPWALGRFYFDYLISAGVVPSNRVLDVGCGAGRVGIWLIPYLEQNRYFGVNSHLRSLAAFARYEAVLHRLKDKNPTLMLCNDFNIAAFGGGFEVVLDFSVTRNLPVDRAATAYESIREAMAPGGRVFMPTAPKAGANGLELEDMDRLGFDLVETRRVRYSVFTESGNVQDIDTWHHFVRR